MKPPIAGDSSSAQHAPIAPSETVIDEMLAGRDDIEVTRNEVRIPGYFEDGAQYANAWLASHPPGDGALAIWGCWDDPAIGAIGTLRATPACRNAQD